MADIKVHWVAFDTAAPVVDVRVTWLAFDTGATVSDLDADRFDYRRALRIPNAYAPDPAIARMGQRMTRRNRW